MASLLQQLPSPRHQCAWLTGILHSVVVPCDAVIAALYDAAAPSLAGLRVHLHPIRLRPGGDDPGRTRSVPVGGAAQQRPASSPPVVGRQDGGLPRRAVYDGGGHLQLRGRLRRRALLGPHGPAPAADHGGRPALRHRLSLGPGLAFHHRHRPHRGDRGCSARRWPSSSAIRLSPSCSTPC